MSLINEALKKAQHQRAAEAGLEQPGPEPGEVVVARAAPRSARTVALMTLGAGLTVLAIAFLTYFLTTSSSTVVASQVRPATKTKPVAKKSDSPQPDAAPTVTPVPAEPTASVPSGPSVATPPVASAETTTMNAPTPTVTPPEAASNLPPAPIPKPELVVAPPPASTAPAVTTTPPVQPAVPAAAPPVTAPAAPKASEQVQAFVDAVRVMGIRASGDDSRVLMNGRQYRLNELVERTLGVRLVKVEGNCLTFADPNGVIYLKYF